MSHERTILVTMPHHFSVRNILYTRVLDEMAARRDVRWVLLGFRESDRRRVERAGRANVVFERLRGPVPGRPVLETVRRWFRRFDEAYLFNALVYRFLAVHRLYALESRRVMSAEQQRLERVFSNFARPLVGAPLPRSKFLYGLLSRLRHGGTELHRSGWVARLFETYEPDAVVHGRAQSPHNLAYTVEANRRGVPVVGVVNSWDHPTTKGFVPPGYETLLVGSEDMARQLVSIHGIDRERIVNTGHVFADTLHGVTSGDEQRARRAVVCEADDEIILLCTNAVTLKAQEPAAARALAREVEAGRFGTLAKLVIRTHPQDPDAEPDFGPLRGERVSVVHASAFGFRDNEGAPRAEDDGRLLAGLLRTASVVINTRSSITLDSIACGTPVINLGYDAVEPRVDADAVRHRYGIEFFEPLVRCGATPVAMSESELMDSVARCLADPSADAAGRAVALRDHLEPFDGRSGARFVETVCRAAGACESSIRGLAA